MFKKSLLGCLTATLLLACNQSFLDIKPFGAVGESTLSNTYGANLLLIGAYSLLDGAGATGGNYTIGVGRLRGADEITQGTETGPSIYNAMLYTESDGSIEDRWKLTYSAVGRCNDVLRILPQVTDASEADRVQLEAEAKFLRGVYYLSLVMFYKNVPWIDESIEYGKNNYFVPNTDNIYPKIEADFQFAATNLTETKSQVGRANKWAAKSFLAKTLIFQNKFAEAKTILEDVIANGKTSNGLKYKLLSRYNENFYHKNQKWQ